VDENVRKKYNEENAKAEGGETEGNELGPVIHRLRLQEKQYKNQRKEEKR
jgi:hypothetical protein